MRRHTKGELLQDCSRHDVRYFVRFDADAVIPSLAGIDGVDHEGHAIESRAVAKLSGKQFQGVTVDVFRGTPKADALKMLDKIRDFMAQQEEEYFDFPIFEVELGRVTNEVPF
jgi:hypothetical protein